MKSTTGLILKRPSFKTWQFKRKFRKHRSIGSSPINPSGDWTNFLPKNEYQLHRKFDDYGCVTHSAQNLLETLLYFKMKALDRNDITQTLASLGMLDDTGRPNFDDWFTVLMSGTTPGRGNSQERVWDNIRTLGLIGQLPFDENMSQAEYYNKNNTKPEMLSKAKKFLEHFKINSEYLKTVGLPIWAGGTKSALGEIKEGLTHSPLQTVVNNGTHCEMTYNEDSGEELSLNSYKGRELLRRNYGYHQFHIKADCELIKPLAMPQLYKKAGTKAIYFLNLDDMKLVPYADGIVSGGSMFKTTGLVYSMAERVEELPYEIADYSMTTIKNIDLIKLNS